MSYVHYVLYTYVHYLLYSYVHYVLYSYVHYVLYTSRSVDYCHNNHNLISSLFQTEYVRISAKRSVCTSPSWRSTQSSSFCPRSAGCCACSCRPTSSSRASVSSTWSGRPSSSKSGSGRARPTRIIGERLGRSRSRSRGPPIMARRA